MEARLQELSHRQAGRSVRPKDAAVALGIAPATFWRWQKERPDMPRGMRLSERCTVYDLDALLQWRDSHLITSQKQEAA
jgi:predicted DNA-binding transcriptional regulator AlpA